MLTQKITYIVEGEKVDETLSKRENAQKWLKQKALYVADSISHLKGRAKTKFEEDPDGYILNYFSEEDFEKCVYAAMPTQAPFSVEGSQVIFNMIFQVSRLTDYKESDITTSKTGCSTQKFNKFTEQVLTEVRDYKTEIHKKR
jgi:hypothetical protein